MFEQGKAKMAAHRAAAQHQQAQQQAQQQQAPQQGDQIKQVVAGVAQMLQKGMQPKEILPQLVKMGYSQDQAIQVIQMASQQAQGQQGGDPSQQGQQQQQQAPPQQQQQMQGQPQQ